MGSVFSGTHGSNDLYNEIRTSIDELLDEYKFWTNKNVCKDLEFVYYDKLIRFKKSDLLNASTAIGYKFNDNVNKPAICNTIISHYKKRIELLKYILQTVQKAQQKIDRANNGPVCRNVDGFISDLYNCNQIKGAEWMNKNAYKEYVKQLKKHERYDTWKHWLDKLINYYDTTLQKIQIIINKIKGDVNRSISEGEYKALMAHTQETLKSLNTLSDIYYLLAINNC